LLGSTLFSLLAVLGLTALLAPQPLSISPNALAFDFPVLIAVAVACLPIFFAGQRINRWEGLLFLAYYLAYGLHQLLFAAGAPAIREFHHAMAWYALPLTALTLMLLVARAWRVQRRNTQV
ncbi:MAG: calcium/sodium antiporter, partial [Pseudomonas sp.]